jgi:1,4-dihydroxy-2-naphthoate polyprenyltransferase
MTRVSILRLSAFIRVSRPLFLVGGLVLHALGIAVALYSGARLNLPALIWGQIIITGIQVMTHFANEYFDLEADRLNQTPTFWSGGSRVLPRGELPPVVALRAAWVCGLIALMAALILALTVRPGPLTLPLTGLCLLMAWAYSAPPFRMHSRGLGELHAAILVSGLTPICGYYFQTGTLAVLPELAVIPVCLFQFNMILAVALPDVEGDARVNKRTLPVILGRRNAAKLYLVILLAAYAVLPLLVTLGLPRQVAVTMGAGTIPLAAAALVGVFRGEWSNPRHWSRFIFFSLALLICSALLEAAAFVASVRW